MKMKKDIFIDTNIASRFTNPMDTEYIKLIKWLLKYDKNSDNNAYLVVSKKLLAEYNRSAMNSHTDTCIGVIINALLSQGRLTIITNDQIKEFQRVYFTKKVEKHLRSNNEDRQHIPVVLLSERKFALAIDDNFVYDLTHFSGFITRVEKRPERLQYEN